MRVVVSLVAPDVDMMVRLAATAEADLLEVRLDALSRVGEGEIRALGRAIGSRAVATLRPEGEGGRSKLAETEREAILAVAVDSGFAAVDVEAGASFRDRLLAKARGVHVETIVSIHDLGGARPAPEVLRLLEAAHRAGASVAKYAAAGRGPEDFARLRSVARGAAARAIPFAVMGVDDAVLRISAGALGASLVYASHPAGEKAAAGQVAAPLLRRLLRQAATARLGPETRPVLLLGDPVDHSRSPAMQNAAFAASGVDLAYLPYPTPDAASGIEAVRRSGAAGANVTTPHKEAVLPLVDTVDPFARRVRAANTIVAEAGRLVAYNTDGPGVAALFAERGVAVDGKAVVVLGAGPAARAVAHALADRGARVLVANRTRERGAALAAEVGGESVQWTPDAVAGALRGAVALVSAASLGRPADPVPVPTKALRPDLFVLDAVYATGETPLLAMAGKAGAETADGLDWLLHQGALSFALWTGRPAPVEAMRSAARGARP
ncbi:MAG: type I 3-dehydroquinate dehydratase [Methanobacteriota archaeon]